MAEELKKEVETEEVEPLFVNLTDDDGVEHSFQLLTIFTAGNLNRQYGALLTQDVVLYRYYLSDSRECGEEISEADFPSVSAFWQGVAEKLDGSKVREATLYLMDSEVGDLVPCTGTILSTFVTPFSGEFVAFIPHAIHFYRYEEKELENGDFEVSWESIINPHEYEDVATEFDKYIE